MYVPVWESRPTDFESLTFAIPLQKPVFNPNSIEFTEGPFDAYDVLGAKPWKPSE
jgi:hypothetical protein